MDHRVTLVAALIACGRGGENAPPPPDAGTATDTINAALSATPRQDTGFAGTSAATHRARPGAPQAVLRAVESTTQPGYDRVVFEFAGDSVPGYHLEYATRTVRRCGSGDPVSVTGAGRLIVRFEPARAHDDQGNPAPVERERAPGLAAVKEMKLICDFEGQVEWVLGVAGAAPAPPAPYRVSERVAPARLILEVRHAP